METGYLVFSFSSLRQYPHPYYLCLLPYSLWQLPQGEGQGKSDCHQTEVWIRGILD